jgi:hypothetical protein
MRLGGNLLEICRLAQNVLKKRQDGVWFMKMVLIACVDVVFT